MKGNAGRSNTRKDTAAVVNCSGDNYAEQAVVRIKAFYVKVLEYLSTVVKMVCYAEPNAATFSF